MSQFSKPTILQKTFINNYITHYNKNRWKTKLSNSWKCTANRGKREVKEGKQLIETMQASFEQWKLIDGFDNYSVSAYGRLRNNLTWKVLKGAPTASADIFKKK